MSCNGRVCVAAVVVGGCVSVGGGAIVCSMCVCSKQWKGLAVY